MSNKAVIPQLSLEIEILILSFKADLEALDLHRLNTQQLVREIHFLVHKWSRVECWCRSKIVCRCIQRRLSPRRMKTRYYMGYGFKDLVMECTRKIELGWYFMRCTSCSSGCPCNFRYPEKLRNGQELISAECDKKFLEWETDGKVKCWNQPENQKEYCERCKNSRLIRVSGKAT
jgi:hypothetical protein